MSDQELINIGTLPNDGEGDPLRVAFGKINNNFTELFSTTTSIQNSYTVGNLTNQVIFQTPATVFSQAQFYIRTSEVGGTDSQVIQLYAQTNNDNSSVKFTGYGSSFFGDYLSSFDMDVVGGNVRILANPIVSTELLHSVAVQILYQGEITQGIPLGLNGYADSVMSTEDDQVVTTE